MTEARAKVVRYKLRKHPDADALSIADIEGSAWQVVSRTADFAPEGTAIYLPVDTVVPETPEFEFLRERHFRIKAIRLRGVYSYGLLIPNKENLPVGEDVTDRLGIKKYEPPTPIDMTGEVVSPSEVDWICIYTDIERYENFPDVFKDQEEVVVTEKIHGSNLRVSKNGHNLFVGGHRWMWKESEKNLYWKAISRNGFDKILLEKLPDKMVLFGEVYGKKVQKLQYGSDTQRIVFYDAFQDGRYLNWDEFMELMKGIGLAENIVPIIYRGGYELAMIKNLATGNTLLGGDHHKEGVVVKPIIGRVDAQLGRVTLKFINPAYETSKERTDFH
ncbi:MAG: RNA ligase (ATP) [bacterium]|nr:RNA ligase (ATP) [bacterium]